MSWLVLKPTPGLADKPSVCAKLSISKCLVLAAVTLAASAIPASAGAATPGPSNNASTTSEIAAVELLRNSPSAANLQSWAIASAISPGYTIRRTVPEVRLQFSVADEHGRPVTDLSARDVRILDNHSAVRRFRQFARADDLPLEVGLLLDVSDSVQKSILREKLATQIFIRHVLRPQTDRAFLVAFGRDVTLWQPSTGDPLALRQAVERVHQLGYATNLYDGLYYACANQFPRLSQDNVVQRILLLLSDGEDTGSLHAMADAIAQAQRHEIQIYAMSVHPLRKYSPGDAVLRQMSEETGGQFYLAGSEKDFSAIFTAMERQLRTQYSVSFPPERETPGFHDLRVETTSDPTFHVHARHGYYYDAR